MAVGGTERQGRPRGGEAQAVAELQRAWADLQRGMERVERAEWEGGRGARGSPPTTAIRAAGYPAGAGE